MTKAPPPFLKAGIDTISAMKLFVHLCGLRTTSFTSTMQPVEGLLCPTVHFKALQATGSITRTPEDIVLTIIPDQTTAADFVPRTIKFRRADFRLSTIMTTPDDNIIAGGGRQYALTIATAIANAHPKSAYKPSPCGGEHTILMGAAPGQNVHHMLARLAQEIDGSRPGEMFCLISHPSLDQAADVTLIDDQDRSLQPTGALADLIASMRAAAQHLPSALRFTQEGAAYPLPFRVYPHRFTLERESDSTMRTARGMIARASLKSLDASTAQFHQCVVQITQPGSFEPSEAAKLAKEQLLIDWAAVMPDVPAPEIKADHSIEPAFGTDEISVRITLIVSPEHAERYSIAGQYEMQPE